MGHMMRKLFRPGVGERHQNLTVAFVNGTLYGGDVCVWDTTAPTSQAYNGATDTLGSNDFIYVTTSSTAYGLAAGITLAGGGSEMDSVTAITDDNIAVIQTWGVCINCQTVDDTVAAGAGLILDATAGQLGDAALGTDTIDGSVVGVALTADYTFTRAAATVYGVTGFVRCNG